MGAGGHPSAAARHPAAGEADQAWYSALAPYPNPEIAVVVTVEQGGFGADTAAPVALQVLQAYFDKQAHAVAGGAGSVE